jgi:hypothetical protein
MVRHGKHHRHPTARNLLISLYQKELGHPVMQSFMPKTPLNTD